MDLKFNEAYWIAIVDALGFGSSKINSILGYYKDAKSFFDAGLDGWRLCGFLSAKNIEKLRAMSLNKTYKVIEKCENLGYEIITIENPQYPKKLKNIGNPPGVLYVKGRLPSFDDSLCISIVGTRSSSAYGNKISFEMGYKLAKAGAIVISGGAIGIDCLAQKGALQARGKAIAVLGCGINFNYLMANKNLRDAIAQNGALVSEYPPDYRCFFWTFPMRNRVISGMSDGILVVEAGEKSGSLITAKMALEQGRDLFAVPGNINSSVSDGTNKLIKICAKPVMRVEDILEEYYHLYPELRQVSDVNVPAAHIMKKLTVPDEDDKNKSDFKVPNKSSNREVLDKLSARANAVFEVLTEKPMVVDEISELAKLSVPEVLQAITELELYEIIRPHAGKRYSRI